MRTLAVNWQILPFFLKTHDGLLYLFQSRNRAGGKSDRGRKIPATTRTGAIGNQGKLQRRPESANDLHTWMEVYANVPDDFTALLEKLVQQTGLAELQYSERRTEYFLDVDVCA
jgi:hypothetical protein